MPTILAAMWVAHTMSALHPHSNPLALLRLCHLVSPALPVGAYAYSQGLEYAVHGGWVSDEASAYEWLQGMLQLSVGTLDLPILVRAYRAWVADDRVTLRAWNARLLAARETEELRAEERHLGLALARLLIGLDVIAARDWQQSDPTFATLFALAATHWGIAERDAVCGYAWSWCENQVLAAVKLVPLGQSAGQRLLYRLAEVIPILAEQAVDSVDDAIGVSVPSQALGSALHEMQYSRLCRS